MNFVGYHLVTRIRSKYTLEISKITIFGPHFLSKYDRPLHDLGRFRTISQNRCQSGGASSRSEGSAEESLGRLMRDFPIKWPLEEAQFSLSQNSSLYYDSVYYDPLSSLLGFYGNIILGAELDTWSSLGGSQHYEKARSIAVRASASNFSRGWEQRLLLINLLTDNVGLRKLRFSTYLSYELFENGNIDECILALDELIKNLDEIFNNYSQENYTNMFMKYHGPKIGEIMEKLGQKEMLLELQDLDSQRSNIYKEFYSNI